MSKSTPPPDLQEWIARYGGYWNIPWDEFDRAIAAYRAERSKQIVGDIDVAARKQKGQAA